MTTHNWKATKLADAYSLAELETLRQSVVGDPRSANPAHAAGKSVYLYTAAARRKLDALAWAVTYRLAAQRAAVTP